MEEFKEDFNKTKTHDPEIKSFYNIARATGKLGSRAEIESKKNKQKRQVNEYIKNNFPDDPTPFPPWKYGHLECGKMGSPKCGYCQKITRMEKMMNRWNESEDFYKLHKKNREKIVKKWNLPSKQE